MKKKKNICAPCHSLKSKPARGTSLLLFVYDQPVLDSLLVQFLPCIISDIDCYLLLIKRMELYCGFVINCFFFFSFYKFRKKNIAAYIALKVMQSTRFLYYIHIGATILATRASFIQTLISVLVTRRQNITLFERFHKELLLNDFLNLFQGICKVYAPLPSILHSEQPILHVFTTYDCSALMPLCSLSFPET